MLHIVGGRGIFLHLFLHWTGRVMFGNSHFGIAQSPCNGLHCPSFLGKFGLEHDKVPLGIRLVNVQYQCGMCRITPYIIQGLLHACFFGPRFWARNGVFHFVGSMWIAFNTRWQVKSPFGGSQELCTLRGTILCPRIRPHGLCQGPWISIRDNSLKLHWYWIMAFNNWPFSNHDM